MKPPCFKCGRPSATVGGTPLCEEHWLVKIAKRSLGSVLHLPVLKKLWEEQGGRCAYTGMELQMGVNATIDHRTPTSRGGTHAVENLHWIDRGVNGFKANRTHEEFLETCRSVVDHQKMAHRVRRQEKRKRNASLVPRKVAPSLPPDRAGA